MAAKFSPGPATYTSGSNASARRVHISPTPQQQQDGLPKAFVASLRVLFDILDEDKDGLVPFTEIKERWQSDEGPSGLPVDVIDSLRKVAPKNGKLSFERFCSGLRLALAKDRSPEERGPPRKSDKQPKPTTATVRPNVVHPMQTKSAPQLRAATDKRSRSLSENETEKLYDKSTPKMYNNVPKPSRKQYRHSTGNYESYHARPNGLGDKAGNQESHYARPSGVRLGVQSRQISRASKGIKESQDESGPSVPTRKDVPPNPYNHSDYMDYADLYHSPVTVSGKERPSIRTRAMSPSSRALSPSSRPMSPTRPVSPTSRPLSPASRAMSPTSRPIEREVRRRSASKERKSVRQLQYGADNGSEMKQESGRGRSPDRRPPPPVYNTNHNSNHVPSNGSRESDSSIPVAVTKRNRRQRDGPRRHTLNNGISVDYNILKRMKQLEQERDILIQGLEAVDRAKDWYQRELACVKDKQRYIHKGQFASGEDPNSQSQQDRLAFQALRIVEVNRQLAALVDSAEKGFPDHINLAMRGRHSIYLPVDTPISAQLRDQNRMLTKEVTHKSDRITQLEQEKSTLIRQLFDVRSKSQRTQDPPETSLFL